jgi:hypothetical protein
MNDQLQGPGLPLDQLAGGMRHWQESERAAMKRALELSKGSPPAHNIAPLLGLVRMAHSMGYDVVPKK